MKLARATNHTARSRRRPKPERLEADLLFGPEKNALGKTVSALQSAVALNLRLAETANRASTELYESTRRMVGMGIVLSNIVGLFLALVIGRIIVGPIHRLIAVAWRIAAGDFSGEAAAINKRDRM